MGILEQEVRKRHRRTKVQQAVLSTLYLAGVLSVALMAPNALRALKLFDSGKQRRRDPKYVVNQAISRLKDKGLIVFEKTPRGTFVRLTVLGKEAIERIYDPRALLKKPKKWDGKWRLIIFDIQEKRRGDRNLLRTKFQQLGLVRLQHSVWAYPYDCEDVIILLKADFKIGKDVLYIVAEKIENDACLRQHFGLS